MRRQLQHIVALLVSPWSRDELVIGIEGELGGVLIDIDVVAVVGERGGGWGVVLV